MQGRNAPAHYWSRETAFHEVAGTSAGPMIRQLQKSVWASRRAAEIPHCWRLRFLAGPFVAIAAIALAGCGVTDSMGSFWVDPARYSAYRCKQLADEARGLAAREKQLRDLMSKASEGTGGALIGTLSYRGDYQTVLEQEKLVQRTAADKNCTQANTTTYTSDQTIR